MQPRDIATREDAIAYLRRLDASYDLRTRNYDRDPSSSPQTVLGSVIERIEALWPEPAVPADADRIASLLAGKLPPVLADARRGVVIVRDYQDAALSRDTRVGVCSKDATDDQLRAAAGLEADMSGPPRVERKALPGLTNLQAFTVTGYTGD